MAASGDLAVSGDQSPAGAGYAMTRGEAVSKIVSAFNLEEKQKDFLRDCIKHPDDCFFVFAAMSDYDGIQFFPLILYPDVFPAYRHYKSINTASMLGLVHGYLEEETSPFHPEAEMTRIQALKVVLGAAELMKWKDRFEMAEADYISDLPFTDPEITSYDGWWYSRYLDFALERELIDPVTAFEPDRAITKAELDDLVARTIDFLPMQK